MARTTGVDGVLVSMSEGLYVPTIQVLDYATSKKFICDPGSLAAREAGMDNPNHWAWAVFRALKDFCHNNQVALQGGSMDARRHGYGD